MDRALLQIELIRDEGLVLAAYDDSEGFVTIGVGRLIDPRHGGGISHEEALYLLRNDLDRIERELVQALPWWARIDPVRQRVLMNMAFNLGVSGLMTFHRTLAAIERGTYDQAADAMLASKWAAQVGRRAERLASLMRNG